MTWRVTFFVSGAERTLDGWRVCGDDGLGPPIVGDRFTFVQPQQDAESQVDLQVVEVCSAGLRLVGTSDRPLRPGDILGGTRER